MTTPLVDCAVLISASLSVADLSAIEVARHPDDSQLHGRPPWRCRKGESRHNFPPRDLSVRRATPLCFAPPAALPQQAMDRLEIQRLQRRPQRGQWLLSRPIWPQLQQALMLGIVGTSADRFSGRPHVAWMRPGGGTLRCGPTPRSNELTRTAKLAPAIRGGKRGTAHRISRAETPFGQGWTFPADTPRAPHLPNGAASSLTGSGRMNSPLPQT